MSLQLPSKTHKLYTLILPVCLDTKRVLLGYKKRGFGVGKYNGFGGKVELNETIVAGAARELVEESGIIATEEQLIHRAILLLETTADDVQPLLEIHVYVCTSWGGEIVETDEMKPYWYAPADMPLADMWEETRFWLRTLLEGVYFTNSCVTVSVVGVGEVVTDDDRFGFSGEARGVVVDGKAGGQGTGFVHYVQFHGGRNKHTDEWDAWHGMGKQLLKWYDDGVGSWDPAEVKIWTDAQREKWRVDGETTEENNR